MDALLAALDVFSRAPDKAQLDSANAWLQDFQHSPEAWATCNTLLLSPDAPPTAKLFAAQTFRTKVTFDLSQVDTKNLFSLRDTLISALIHYNAGPRNVTTQLCLALAGLALQLPQWTDAVPSIIEKFGTSPTTVPTLLQFLTLLPEELTGNSRIPVTDHEYRERAVLLMSNNSKQVLQLLSVYVQAPGVTAAIQSQVFDCLRSWLLAGEVLTSDLAATPLLAFSFEALNSENLFDAAVDVICEMIHETQEIDDNMAVIELIVPRVTALKPRIQADKDDDDKIKGFARIFTEAGETYRMLLLQHTEAFYPIVEAIGECSAHPDLDIVPITFPFWMRLAQSIGKRSNVPQLLIDAYKSLMSVIIGHLHFPSDSSTMTTQEADNFRAFRHVMGDTLKDCCYVLGVDQCLSAAYNMVTVALAQPQSGMAWQAIEAPLFAMRSLGAQIDSAEGAIVPNIMNLIPTLPLHPRVRYAALLIVSRYTEWIDRHPEYIQPQLAYISAGFEDSDAEVSAAAGHALKYLCQDCKKHLIEFTPTLHTFLKNFGAKLSQDDKMKVYEAIAHVISAMPMERAAETLRAFALDILAEIHALVSRDAVASQPEILAVGNNLENLETMLDVIRTFGEDLPAACQGTIEDSWAIFDLLIQKYGTDYELAERVTRVLRHGLTFFGQATKNIAGSVLARMTSAFELTGIPSYIWISGKLISTFEESSTLRDTFKTAFERSTAKVISLLQEKTPNSMPDVLQDYIVFIQQMGDCAPDMFYPSPAFPLAFRATLAGLSVIHSEIIFASLDFYRNTLTHGCLTNVNSPPPAFPIYATSINTAVEKEGFGLVNYIISGMVGDFPEEALSTVVTILTSIASIWPTQMSAWLPPILEQLPPTDAPLPARTQFLEDMNAAIQSRQYDKTKYAILGLNRASRKAKDRRRTTGFKSS